MSVTSCPDELLAAAKRWLLTQCQAACTQHSNSIDRATYYCSTIVVCSALWM